MDPPAVHTVVYNRQTLLHRSDGEAERALLKRRAEWGAGRAELALLGIPAIPEAATRAAWKTKGVELLAYVPDDTWLARVHGAAGPETNFMHGLTLFQPLDARLRLDPALFESTACEAVPAYVYLARDADAQSLRRELAARGFSDFTRHAAVGMEYLAGRVPSARLTEWATFVGDNSAVQYVARGYGARLMNRDGARVLQSGSYVGPHPVWSQGVYGSNQVVAVLDTGLDLDSCYFRDSAGAMPATNRVGGTYVSPSLRKVIAADFLYAGDDPANAGDWDNQGHGTRVAGHAVGASLSDPVGTNGYNGMAPGALLVVQDAGFSVFDSCADLVGLGCPVTNFLPSLRQAHAQGARVHNNSWGDNEDGVFTNLHAYTQASRDLDGMTWEYRDFLVVCAAGNSGGPQDKVASPSNAKNALSVAAGQSGSSQESMASFSSRGWTEDGRIKPDLTAPGSGVTSSSSDGSLLSSNCTTATGNGTSYASPMVAGLAALVRDYFAQGFYPSGARVASNALPSVSAALVKAMLINACVPMSNAIAAPPARDQGWGRVNLSRTLAFTNSPHQLWMSDGAKRWGEPPGQPLVQYLDVHATNVPLKVTLVWTDYPGTPGAGKQLINDLDLVVRSGTNVLLGNVLTGGWSVAGGALDRSNNVEQVNWFPAATGLVEISVWAHVVPVATQDCAVVVSGVFSALDPRADTDGDGLGDVAERWHRGSLTAVDASSDADADGVPDGAEWTAGTMVSNSMDFLRWSEIRLDAAPEISLALEGVPGRRYTLQYAEPNSDDVATWHSFSNELAGVRVVAQPFSNSWLNFTDTFGSNDSGRADSGGARVYRLVVEAP
jgi:subtilisin family serine protease